METEKKILRTPLRIAISLLVLGFLCKILHLKTIADPLILVSLIAIGILYAWRFWNKTKKGFLQYNKLVLVTSWSLNGIFKILDISHNEFFQVIGGLAFIIWIIMEGTTYLIDDKEDDRSDIAYFMWNTMMIIGILAIIIGSLTKILEWEYATPTLITGFVLVAAYVLKDLLVQNLQKKE
ncbi:hypothetical protein SAMN03080594_102421 [Arenibacter palladensis]|uniref:Uncharacterized protein n=1 Tax=Arenibacter palladensis TaxID=237373 RepID=A0A1M4YFR3_9FLAO|nr:hypothetical protein [Arenibacter palladensis]SHF04352.1 hypothetical protein SAMN03080594_102421 [Arenibacter palladensis]